MYVDGNVYLLDATPYNNETNLLQLKYNPNIKIEENGDEVILNLAWNKQINKMKNNIVSSDFLGKAEVSDTRFEAPDGSSFVVGTDFFEEKRNPKNPTAGPFEKPGGGELKLVVWKKINKN